MVSAGDAGDANPAAPPPRRLLGLDLGQASDFSCLVGLDRQQGEGRACYSVRHLERYRLGTSYPEIVAAVMALLRLPELKSASLIVDGTGVGRAVVDLFRPLGRRLVKVSIHGGDTTSEVEGWWRVPKRELVGVTQVALQSGRLLFPARLPLVDVLTRELLNFKVTIDPVTAHDSYAAWRDADHDDMVLALALSVWYGERSERPGALPLGFAVKGWGSQASTAPFGRKRQRFL